MRAGRAAAPARLAAALTDASRPVCAYVYDLDVLRDQARRVGRALPDRAELFYAVKANDRRRILATLAPLVDGFDVASGGELAEVRAVSPGAPVIIGGPAKTDKELEAAIEAPAELISVESALELRRLEQAAARQDATAPVCLRVNLRGEVPGAQITMAGAPTQFGIDERELGAASRLAARSGHLDLRGFHVHAVSNNLDAGTHAALVGHVVSRARTWAAEAGIHLRALNLGGGLGVDVVEQKRVFDLTVFSARIRPALEALSADTRVIFECGRLLTAGCGTYVTEVLDLKCNQDRWFCLVRGGTHHFRLPASWGYDHPFTVLPRQDWPYPFDRPELRDQAVTVVGELCTPKDVLAADQPVTRVRPGDLLVFACTGAYGWVISHHDFLRHPHPDEIWIDGASTDPR